MVPDLHWFGCWLDHTKLVKPHNGRHKERKGHAVLGECGSQMRPTDFWNWPKMCHLPRAFLCTPLLHQGALHLWYAIEDSREGCGVKYPIQIDKPWNFLVFEKVRIWTNHKCRSRYPQCYIYSLAVSFDLAAALSVTCLISVAALVR